MTLALISEKRSIFGHLRQFMTIFVCFSALIGSLAVLANDAYYLIHVGLTPSVALFLIAFVVGFLPSALGLAVVLALLPLTAGIPSLAKATLGWDLLAMPNPGLDLVGGLFLSQMAQPAKLKILRGMLFGFKNSQEKQVLNSQWTLTLVWPIGLVLLVICLSAALAIARNLYLSATSTSVKGVLFNLMHFRPLDWRADYLPMGNWVAYAIAAALIAIAINVLKQLSPEKRNAWVFRPLMVGLGISALVGLLQAATGLGLPEAQLGFRKDAFGYAAMGLQPDLHAYAAHMLLGVVGLWGYFLVCKSRLEKTLVGLIFLLCFAALVASKSRASLMIAIIALVIFGAIYSYHQGKKYFFIALGIVLAAVLCIIIGIKMSQSIANQSTAIASLGWIGELISQMHQRRLSNLSDLGGMMGSRFEIWSAVGNMFSAYPLLGVGEGEFYRLSSNISFAKSEFLQLNHGENAHNYFLQVLAENGLIGILVFVLAFVVPYRACNNNHFVLPTVIGIVSLFLGNVFAHSFLVRENLLLGAALLGLLYVFASDFTKTASHALTKRMNYLIRILILVLFGGMISEVYFSFGRLPFKAGADCFVKELPLYKDGWTSGAWEERLPKGAKAIDLQIIPNRTNLTQKPLTASFEILSWEVGKGKVPVATVTREWRSNESVTLHLDLPPQYYQSKDVITTRLQLSSCYTPRNLGINTDGRRLGVLIEDLRYH